MLKSERSEIRKVPFVPLKEMHDSIRPVLHEAARRVIDSGCYINGPETEAFSHEISEVLGLHNVVPVSNGLDALRLIIRGYIEAGNIRPGDEVLIPSNTYIASLLPLMEFSLKPVLVRPSLSTFGIDWEAAEKLVTDKTRALLTVHLYGTPSWDFEIADRLREKGIIIIEDNAQAIGAAISNPATGRKFFTGALGDAAAFSFYPTKNIGALGDAGLVATKGPELAATVKSLANYGSTERYKNRYVGFNCRMDELQAAILRYKLTKLSDTTARRQRSAEHYDRLINHPAVAKPSFLIGTEQVWHQYVVRTSLRAELRKHLADHGVATDVHYPVSLFNQECVKSFRPPLEEIGDTAENSQLLSDSLISLPIADVSKEDIEYISELINNYAEGKG